jgi:hypothetical protein
LRGRRERITAIEKRYEGKGKKAGKISQLFLDRMIRSISFVVPKAK